MDGQTDGWINIWMFGCLYGWMNEVDSWLVEWVGEVDGWVRWMDGWIQGWISCIQPDTYSTCMTDLEIPLLEQLTQTQCAVHDYLYILIN